MGKAPTALSVEHTSTLYPGLLLPAVLPGHDLPGRGQPAQQQQEGAGRKRRPWTGAPASWGLDPDGGLCNAPLDLKYKIQIYTSICNVSLLVLHREQWSAYRLTIYRDT